MEIDEKEYNSVVLAALLLYILLKKKPKQFIIPIYQQRLTNISLLPAAFGRALFSIVFKAGK
jgi:hypothetical protein